MQASLVSLDGDLYDQLMAIQTNIRTMTTQLATMSKLVDIQDGEEVQEEEEEEEEEDDDVETDLILQEVRDSCKDTCLDLVAARINSKVGEPLTDTQCITGNMDIEKGDRKILIMDETTSTIASDTSFTIINPVNIIQNNNKNIVKSVVNDNILVTKKNVAKGNKQDQILVDQALRTPHLSLNDLQRDHLSHASIHNVQQTHQRSVEQAQSPTQEHLNSQTATKHHHSAAIAEPPRHLLQLVLTDSDSDNPNGLVYGDSDIDEVDLDSLEGDSKVS